MGKVKLTLHSDLPENVGEKRLIEFLELNLPNDYYIIPNGEYASKTGAVKYWEYDVIVVAPHAIYNIENKDWGGRLEGDDFFWYVNSAERKNPHKSATLKSRVLASILLAKEPVWGKAYVQTLVTLSNKMQTKFGLDPNAACYNATFLLDQHLIDFLTNASLLNKRPDAIADIQEDIVNFLTGESSHKSHKEDEIPNYKIDEVLQVCEDYKEYLCHKVDLDGLIIRKYKIRAYPLDKEGLSGEELQKFIYKIQNAQSAQQKLGICPYILTTECSTNEDVTVYYERSDFMDESTLRAMLKKRTFTEMEKMRIITDVARALAASHEAGVFHREVSPENIFIVSGGNAVLGNFSHAWFAEHSDVKYTVNTRLTKIDDSPYMAPEVADGDALAASDIYSLGVVAYEMLVGKLPFKSTLTFRAKLGGELPDELLPSSVANELPHWVDTLIKKSVVEDPDKRWESAQAMIDFIEDNMKPKQATIKAPTVKATTTKSVSVPSSTKKVFLKDLKPGDKVTNDLVLYSELGKGGFGRVFKAKHIVNDTYHAIKLFEVGSSVEESKSEFEALTQLSHNNIVKYVYNGISNQGMFYTLMELLEGDNLGIYVNGNLRMPVNEIYRMAKQILSALVDMQGKIPPIFHRDIKPENIIWDKCQRYVLIDFNISTSSDDKMFAGTEPYMAPDLIEDNKHINWDTSADTFALGITMYELLAQAYPWPGSKRVPQIGKQPIEITQYNDKLSDAFAEFIMRSIKTDSSKRFANAKDMLVALENIGENGMLKSPKKETSEEPELKDDKTIVDYLNSLYSQSHHGNSGTRTAITPGASSAFDALTYTRTKLDLKLQPDILDLKYRLVIITGNAGDGKTAFIRQIENVAENRKQLNSNNGSEFYIKGVRFESNYDGSQDEDSKANNDVLEQFFRPFLGLTDYNKATEGRLIAINEGRLVDFLSQQPELKVLQDNIEDYFYEEGHTELLPGLMIINLNKRSVTANEDGESLVSKQIKKLTAPELWTKCSGCPVADRCYIKYNVDTFADSTSGLEVINRLEWLLRTVVYRRELHITMRDLRSLIAFMLTRDYSCNEVKQLIEYCQTENMPDLFWQYYYFNITAGSIIPKNKPFPLPTLESADRLVKLLRETDIAEVAIPPVDRDLYYKTKFPTDYLTFADRDRVLLTEFNKVGEVSPYWEIEGKRFDVEVRHKTFIRHQYFEGKNVEGKTSYKKRLPYRYVTAFHDALIGKESVEKIKLSLAKAISASEGCDNSRLTDGYMLLSNTHVNDPISKSYRRFSIDEFELFVNKTGHLADYIEYENDSFTFRHKTDTFIRLTISLDLFEMLKYIQNGFSPSINDLRGRFIELQIFKNLLESKSYSEILVTKNNKKFSVISMDDEKNILIKSLDETLVEENEN